MKKLLIIPLLATVLHINAIEPVKEYRYSDEEILELSKYCQCDLTDQDLHVAIHAHLQHAGLSQDVRYQQDDSVKDDLKKAQLISICSLKCNN